ncbi:methyltransferase domain-containing protein [Amylostereum chailletii]|nr:methyltransferase domain-containing protein [Amylostereum chailletii]
MSPKKSHEVIRMTNYILDLTARPTFKDVRHIVDIGAGQGYLSRALAQVGFHVLALDGDASQTEGAERRATSKTKSHHQDKLFDNLPSSPGRGRGSLTHVTNHITPSTLDSSVSSWIHESVFTSECITPVPVLFVALHACGTLTPDIFRTFVAYHHTPTNKEDCQIPLWSPIGTAIVGCCYNLMSPDSDFPLSKAYSRFPSVTYSNLQLAAQVPSRWLDSPLSTETSIRKVAYRSLLERFVPTSASTGPSSVAASNPKKRLGRLSDSAYTSFPVFLDRASTKLGFQLPALLTVNGSSELISATAAAPPMDPGSPVFKSSQRQLEVLHVLRSILGPVIESTIILDRLAWLREALGVSRVSRAGEDVGWDVNLVGIFDQVAGSARNFAITITPSTSTNISPA